MIKISNQTLYMKTFHVWVNDDPHCGINQANHCVLNEDDNILSVIKRAIGNALSEWRSTC